MIVIESPSKRYRATIRRWGSQDVLVEIYDRGVNARAGAGRRLCRSEAFDTSLEEARIAVNNFLITLPDGVNHKLEDFIK